MKEHIVEIGVRFLSLVLSIACIMFAWRCGIAYMYVIRAIEIADPHFFRTGSTENLWLFCSVVTMSVIMIMGCSIYLHKGSRYMPTLALCGAILILAHLFYAGLTQMLVYLPMVEP